MSYIVPGDWEEHIDRILAEPGVTVVIGNIDSGKTTFCSILANRAFAVGVPSAVVDADLGQSEIGPPVTVGLGLVDSEVGSIGNIRPRSICFVGSTSPVGHMLALCTGLHRLTAKARESGRELIIVDTPGMVRGPLARKLHTYETEIIEARHVVALQRGREAEHFLKLFDVWEDCAVHRLSVSPGVVSRSPQVRKQRREVRFRDYFLYAQTHTLSLDDVATSGTWLDTGEPLEPRYLRFAENALGIPVLHGERVDNGVYLVTKGQCDNRGMEELQEQFRTGNVFTVPADRYLHLLVGLLGSRLELLAVASVQDIDFLARTITVATPLRSPSPIRAVSFGVLKVHPSGREIGRVRPGEM